MILKHLHKYLNILNIKYDIDEFDFQIKSHSDYLSLISISDTLHFFKIENNFFKINENEIELLDHWFIALIEKKKEFNVYNELVLVEKKEDNFFIEG